MYLSFSMYRGKWDEKQLTHHLVKRPEIIDDDILLRYEKLIPDICVGLLFIRDLHRKQ